MSPWSCVQLSDPHIVEPGRWANDAVDTEAHLRDADAHLNKLRLYLRLAQRWGWLEPGPYAHVSRMVAEIGRLLGGWLKQTQGGKK